MKIELDDYTVGALAKFYGVSTDTVRLYDRKGILLSQKNDENNYRIYSRDDMIVMDFIVKLRSMDIPLMDIVKIMGDFSIEEIRDYGLNRMNHIDEEMKRLAGLRAKTEEFVKLMEILETNLNKFTVRESPTFILRDIEYSIAATNKHFESLGLHTMPLLTVYGKNGIDPEIVEMASQVETRPSVADFCISQEDHLGVTKRVDFPKDEFLVLQPGMCIYGMFKVQPNKKFDFQHRTIAYAKAHNYKLTGENVVRTVLAKSKGAYQADYYECWSFIDSQ